MKNNLENITNKLMIKDNEVLATVHPSIAQVIHSGIKLTTAGKPLVSGPEVKARSYEGKYMVVDAPDEKSLIPISTNESGKPIIEYPNKLASEMICGYFGELGYVDMIQQSGSPRLIGIVHIPTRLVYLVGAMKGNLEEFYEKFCIERESDRWEKHRWNLETHPSELDEKILKYLPLELKQYYWKIEKTESGIFKSNKPLPQQIDSYVITVKDFITELDNYVYGLRPGSSAEDVINPDIAKNRFEAIQKGDIKQLME